LLGRGPSAVPVLERALDAGAPVTWATADEAYGLQRRPRPNGRLLGWSGWPGPRERSRRASRRPRARSAWTTRGPQVARLVSPHHPGAAAARILGRHPRASHRPERDKGGTRQPERRAGPAAADRTEIRRLLVALVWTTPVRLGFVLAWSKWRRRHQARARRAYYHRREQQVRLEWQRRSALSFSYPASADRSPLDRNVLIHQGVDRIMQKASILGGAFDGDLE
jgi:hypothetical protein